MGIELGGIVKMAIDAVIEFFAKAIPSIINSVVSPERTSRIQNSFYYIFHGKFPGARTNKSIALSKIVIDCNHVRLYGGGRHFPRIPRPRIDRVLSDRQVTLLKETGCSVSPQEVPAPLKQNKSNVHKSLLINIVSKEQANNKTALLTGALCLEFNNGGETDLLVCGVESGFSVLSKSSSNPITMPPLNFRTRDRRNAIESLGQLKFSVAYAYDPLKSGTSIDVAKIARLPRLMKNKTVTVYSRDGQNGELSLKDCFTTEDVAFLVRVNDPRTTSSFYYLTGWKIVDGHVEMRSATGTEAIVKYAKSVADIDKATGIDYKSFVGFLGDIEGNRKAMKNVNLIHKAIRKARKGKSIRHARLKYW